MKWRLPDEGALVCEGRCSTILHLDRVELQYVSENVSDPSTVRWTHLGCSAEDARPRKRLCPDAVEQSTPSKHPISLAGFIADDTVHAQRLPAAALLGWADAWPVGYISRNGVRRKGSRTYAYACKSITSCLKPARHRRIVGLTKEILGGNSLLNDARAIIVKTV